jgi:hypothetical protein
MPTRRALSAAALRERSRDNADCRLARRPGDAVKSTRATKTDVINRAIQAYSYMAKTPVAMASRKVALAGP